MRQIALLIAMSVVETAPAETEQEELDEGFAATDDHHLDEVLAEEGNTAAGAEKPKPPIEIASTKEIGASQTSEQVEYIHDAIYNDLFAEAQELSSDPEVLGCIKAYIAYWAQRYLPRAVIRRNMKRIPSTLK